jgi:predicted Fe-Mo cluster-binding NifX family protein
LYSWAEGNFITLCPDFTKILTVSAILDETVRQNNTRRQDVKIAFTTSGENLDAPLDSRFGRAAKFILYDLEKDYFEVIDNRQNLNGAQGAGIQAAEAIVRAGASGIVTGHCGPNAYRALCAAGIAIYNSVEPTVAAALAAFRAGVLQPMQSADVEGHWV